MKLRFGLLGCLLLAGSATATVYKWVDEQGNVHYGDLPPDQAPAEPVKLPGLSTYKSRAVSQPPVKEPGQDDVFTGYTRVEIIQPQADSAVRANDQRVAVVVALEPALQEGHRVSFELDGKPVGEPQSDLSVTLTGVYRGAHRLQVKVLDAKGASVGQSDAITFYLRQAGAIPPTAPSAPRAPQSPQAPTAKPPAATT